MKSITELTLQQQDMLKKSFQSYPVLTDPQTQQQFVLFMGEAVEYTSILDHNLLLG